MNHAFFLAQIQRLISRFGQKAFDQEFCKLVWREVLDMTEQGFQRFCDVMIGSRTHSRPPLLSEFREARLNEQKIRFDNEVKGAAQTLARKAPEEMRKHLRLVLSGEFGALESVKEALEIATMRRRLAKVDGEK